MSALKYRREIDGLRAIAVLGVVLYHAEPSWLPGGFLGVDVFFVISGYLITSLLLLEHRQSGTVDLAAFYARRVRRLLPALGVLVATTTLAGVWLLHDSHQQLLYSAAASLLFVGNIYFQLNTGDYFDGPTDEVPLLHLWSLGVEEQFYLVLPLLVLLCVRWRGQRGLVGALVVGSVVSLVLAEHWMQIRPSVAFYQMPSRFWEFAAGSLVALAPRKRLRPQLATGVAWAGMGTIVAAMAVGTSAHFPGIGALPVVLGSTALVWSVHDGERSDAPTAVLGSRAMVFFGAISYSLYLWHWPLLALLRAIVWEPSLASRLGACLLAVALAWLSYRHVETPFRTGTRGSTPRTVLAGVGVSAALALAFVGVGHTFATPPLETPDTGTPAAEAALDRPANVRACHFGLGKEVERLQPADCYSDPGKRAGVVLWGDSHALAWQPFAWSVAQAAGTSAAGFTLDSCPPVGNFDTFRADFPRHVENCRRFNALAVEYIREQAPDEVILAGRWLLYFQTRHAKGLRAQSPGSFAAGIAQTVDEIAPHAKKVVLLGPLPALGAPAPRCMSAGDEPRCEMARAEYDRLAAKVWVTFRQIASRHPNVELVDPAGFFCGLQRCPATRDGYALFWDSNHVSSKAARQFAGMYLADPARWQARPAVTAH